MATILSRKPGGGGSGGGVTSLDGLTGAVTLSAGSGITLTPTGQDIEIASTGGALTLIQEIAVGAGGAATVDFTSIPGTYRHLVVEWVAQTENAAAQNLIMRFNNDSGANYSWAQVDVQAGGASAVGPVTEGLAGTLAATGDAHPCIGHIRIPYYKGTTWNKVAYGSCNGFYSAANRQTLQQSFWVNTVAITRITFSAASDIKQGSVFDLYGIL